MARATPRTIFLSAAAACALAAPGAAGAERLFATGAAFPLEEPAVAIALDDFDRDGRLDAAALGLPGVSVLLAGPEGTFLEPRVHPAGLGPAALASGDFTGDGAPDIVVANGGSSTLSVLLNRGAGAFAPAGDVAVGLGPRALALADFDGDGRLDVASSNLRARTVDVRLGDGAGGFPAGQVLQAGDNPHDLTSGDFDGDGAADLAVAHTGAVSWFRGLGDGSFAPPADSPVAPDPRSLATGDLLGDGALDLGAIDDAGGIFALENLGGGKFRDELAGWLTSRGFQGLLGAVQVADFDADGAPDLIATDLQGAESALRVFRRREGGAFGEAPSVHLGVQAGVAVCRDATGDGLLEVLAARSDSAELVLFEGIAPGRVAARTVISLEGGPRGVAALDADRDGVADLVAYSSDGLHLVLGSPAGLEPPVLERIAGAAFQDMTSGDFDGDGRADLALADLALDEARVLLLGDGGQARATRRHPLSGLPSQIAAADLDGDGWADLVAGDQVQTAAMVLFRPGEEQPPPALDLETGGGQTALAIGDLDGDGSLDVAAAGRVGVRLFLGDGARGFPRTRDAGALATTRALRDADQDTDGIGD
ncbi:MAG: VCBS repeat-containing protein, partial [Planctomycetes bacterium]|nr:VCBS repeat-containing protein [Planctomycetota bacterium]